jgi:4-hydroxy-4-methyl-2-oxoglutarate aldolase
VQGAPIRIGGATIARGDLVVADADGVVVIPEAHVPGTLAAAARRETQEAGIMAQLRDGAETLDVYDLRRLGAPSEA